MGSRNPPILIQGAYSDHFQTLQKNGIEILKNDHYFERGDVLHKIKKLQHETQKRRKDQQLRREQEEKKEEERRKHILEERRRHLEEVTEKYQRLGKKRFRLLTATTSPLSSRAATAFEDAMKSSSLRPDGTTSASPLITYNNSSTTRGASADVISRMNEQNMTSHTNGASVNKTDTTPQNEYKRSQNNSTMISTVGTLNLTGSSQTNGLSSFSTQFQAVRASHQRLLEQLGMKTNDKPLSDLHSNGSRIHIDATTSLKPPSGSSGGSNAILDVPSAKPTAVGNNAQKTNVVATAATVQEAMQASYSLNSRSSSASMKTLNSSPPSLQQSMLFLHNNGVISANTNTRHTANHLLGTIIQIQQQQQQVEESKPQVSVGRKIEGQVPTQELQMFSPPKLTGVETKPQVSTVIPFSTPAPPKERPVGLVRPSSASNSVKREIELKPSTNFEDSLNVSGMNQDSLKKPDSQYGSIKTVSQTQQSEEKQPISSNAPDIVRVFNATAPDGATLMAHVNDMKTWTSGNSHNGSTKSGVTLNFQIPNGSKGGDLEPVEQLASAPLVASKQVNKQVLNAFGPVSSNNWQNGNAELTSNNIPVVSRPPIGKSGSMVPPETLYTDLSRPANRYLNLAERNVSSSMKRYNSDSALADQAQTNQHKQNQQLNHAINGDGSGQHSATPKIKSILKRSPSLDRNLASGGSQRASPSVQFNSNTLSSGGAKSVTFGHVHIADLTSDGPIAVRDSIELTKFKHTADENANRGPPNGYRRKVSFNGNNNNDYEEVMDPSYNSTQSTSKTSSGSQIIRVEMGGRSTPRLTQNSNLSSYSRPGFVTNQQKPANKQPHPTGSTTSEYAIVSKPQPVENAPSDAEINWLWEKVRSCLNRSQSATVGNRSTPSPGIPNSYMGPRSQLSSSRIPSGTKVYIDGSNLGSGSGGVQLNANGYPASYNSRAAVSANGSQRNLMATGVRVSPTASRPPSVQNSARDETVSQSTMAFMAAEQLVANGLSESVIHDTIDQIQAQSRQQNINSQLPYNQSNQYTTAAGNGRSALSLEEEQIMKSLDRMNERLQYLEVTGKAGQTASNGSSTSQQPSLAYMPPMMTQKQRCHSAPMATPRRVWYQNPK